MTNWGLSRPVRKYDVDRSDLQEGSPLLSLVVPISDKMMTATCYGCLIVCDFLFKHRLKLGDFYRVLLALPIALDLKTMVSTIYPTLPLDKDQIRLLSLQPGGPADVIKISLHGTHFDVDDPPVYEALSYVWGSVGNLSEIRVESRVDNEKSFEAALFVTQNLFFALKHLQHPTDTRVLWIDAICINQIDKEELSEQVARMADIYRLAARVVIWLGPGNSESDIAMNFITDLGSKMEVDYITQTIKPLTVKIEDQGLDVNRLLPHRDEHITALEEFCSRDWFERLWVVQEVRLANSHAIVVCGSKHCTWKHLRDVLWCIAHKRTTRPLSISRRGKLLEFVDLFNSSFVFTLDGLVSRTRNFKCADPRDRIYAILGICYDQCNVKPNYTLSIMEVYQDAVRQFIRTQHRSDVIRGCELRSDRLSGPTWVPDWSKPKLRPLLRNLHATGEIPAMATFCEGNILRLAGVKCAVTSAITPLSFSGTTNELILAEVSKLLPSDVLIANYKTGCTLLEAFCCTLACSDFTEFHPPRPCELRLEPTLDAMRAYLRISSSEEPFNADQLQLSGFTDRVFAEGKERCLISTDEGYIGLAPPFAQCGDIICVFLGCVSPILLRPVGNGNFQVVGECFVYGLSDSVAILGNLPKEFQAVFAYSEKRKGYRWAYRNSVDGSTSEEDPRLQLLGISSGPHGKEGSCLTNVAQLESSGVEILYFDLI